MTTLTPAQADRLAWIVHERAIVNMTVTPIDRELFDLGLIDIDHVGSGNAVCATEKGITLEPLLQETTI